MVRRLRDYSGNSVMRKSGASIGISTSLSLRCQDCGGLQFESRLALSRKGVRCQKCGSGALAITDSAKDRLGFVKTEDVGERRCKCCRAKLRSSNLDDYCAPCVKEGKDKAHKFLIKREKEWVEQVRSALAEMCAKGELDPEYAVYDGT